MKIIDIDLFQIMNELCTEGEGVQVTLTQYLLRKSQDFSDGVSKDVSLKLFVTKNHAKELERCEPKQMQGYLLRIQQLICDDAAQDKPQLTVAFREALLLQGEALYRSIQKEGITCIEVQGNAILNKNSFLKSLLCYEIQLNMLIFSWGILNGTSELDISKKKHARYDNDIAYLENSHMFITSRIESQKMVRQWVDQFRTQKESELSLHLEKFCCDLNDMIKTLEMIKMINVSSQDNFLRIENKQLELQQFLTEINDLKSTGRFNSARVTKNIAFMKQRVLRECEEVKGFMKKNPDCSDSPTSVVDGVQEGLSSSKVFPPVNDEAASFSSLFFTESAGHSQVGSAGDVSPVPG